MSVTRGETSYLLIPGRRFVCDFRLASRSGLDKIAEFFYQHVLTEKGRSIKQLVESFGLSRRVVEDILIDLLEQNYAALNVRDQRIVKVPNASIDRREDKPGRRNVWLWQDACTGAILPFYMVRDFRYPQKAELEELPPKSLGSADLRYASNAEIIAALGAVSPRLVSYDDPDWKLDSIENRDFDKSWDICVRLGRTDVEGDEIAFIDEPTLPFWLARAWIREFSGAKGNALRLASAQGAGTAGVSYFEQYEIEHIARRWTGCLQELVTALPSGERIDELERLEGDWIARLTETLDRAGQLRVSLHTPAEDGSTHLQEICASAQRCVSVLVNDTDHKRIPELLEVADLHSSCAPPIAAVCRGTRVPVSKCKNLLRVEETPFSPGIATSDGRDFRLGDLQIMLGRAPTVRIEVIGAVGAAYQQLMAGMFKAVPTIGFDEERRKWSEWLGRIDTLPLTPDAQETPGGGLDSQLQHVDIAKAKIRLFQDRLSAAHAAQRQEREALERGVRPRIVRRDEDVTIPQGDELEESSAAAQTLLEIDDQLLELAEEIRQEVSHYIAPQCAIVTPLSDGELFDWLFNALTFAASGRGQFHVRVFMGNGFEILGDQVLYRRLRDVLDVDCKVSIVLTPSPNQKAELERGQGVLISLNERLHGRLDTLNAKAALPDAVMLSSKAFEMTVVGSFAAGAATPFGLLVESKQFAQELRDFSGGI